MQQSKKGKDARSVDAITVDPDLGSHNTVNQRIEMEKKVNALPCEQTYALPSLAQPRAVPMGSSKSIPSNHLALSALKSPSVIFSVSSLAHFCASSYGFLLTPPTQRSAMLESHTWCRFKSCPSHSTWIPFPPLATSSSCSGW